MVQKSHFRVFLIAQVLILIATTVQLTYGGTIRHDRDDSDYIALATQYPSVGQIFGSPGGSAVLIAPNYVLTAAHHIKDVPLSLISFWFTDPPITPIFAASKHVHPDYMSYLLGLDIAVVRLSESILDVTPAELYMGSGELGELGIIVGYGMTGTGITGANEPGGTKRAGGNIIDADDPLNWCLKSDFDNPDNPLDDSMGSPVPTDLEYCFADGDSGGGVFIYEGGHAKLAGVNSYIWAVKDGNPDSDYGDQMFITRVSLFVPWINSIISAGVPDSYEDDDTYVQANWIYTGSPQSHSISPADDVDWFKFSLSTESQVTIETSGSSGDSRMWLKDSGLFHIEYDDDDGCGSFSYIDRMCGVDALPAGTYYVKIDSKDNNHEIPSYTINFTITACGSGNHDPQLSNGSVSPASGDTNTDFYWYIDYYDMDGDPPSTKKVYIDSTDYTMSLDSGSASNGTYRYGPKKLSAASHNYYFYFSESNGGSDRLPSGGTYAGPSVGSGGTPVYFADASLKAAVEAELGVSNPTPADMLELEWLNVYNGGVVDLTGLEYAINMTELLLDLNQISDLSPISGLTNLDYLYLRGNHISDLTPISGLTNLRSVELYGNQISDISALSGLTNIRELWLGFNQIGDIFALSGLTKLGRLSLNDNQISDVSALSGLTSLYNVDLRTNPLNTAAYCTYLPLIAANNPGVALYYDPNPNPGEECPVYFPDSNLKAAVEEELGVSYPMEADMLGLTYLDGSSRGIADLTGLEYATNLTYLFLNINNISDISALSGLTSLEQLFLSENQITDISVLSGLTNLTYLELGGNPLNTAAYCTYLPLIIANNPGLSQLFYDSNPIDFADFAIFAAHWLETGCGVCSGADLDGEEDVDFDDLDILAEHWLIGAAP